MTFDQLLAKYKEETTEKVNRPQKSKGLKSHGEVQQRHRQHQGMAPIGSYMHSPWMFYLAYSYDPAWGYSSVCMQPYYVQYPAQWSWGYCLDRWLVIIRSKQEHLL